MRWAVTVTLLATLGMAQAQAPAPAAAHKAAPKAATKAAPKEPSPVDSVIASVKAGLSEGLIIKTLQSDNKPADLTPADLVKLKNAGVSENIIGVMLDPPARRLQRPPQPPRQRLLPRQPPRPRLLRSRASRGASSGRSRGATTQAEKKRVIVDEFDYSTVKTSVQAVFNTQQDIGKGIRAMLVKRMADANKVVVVERAKVDQLMKEQDFNASNRVKQGSGARVGQISGADALLAGDIVVFGRDDKKTNIGAGGFARGLRRNSHQEGRGQGRGRHRLPPDRRRNFRSHRHRRGPRRIRSARATHSAAWAACSGSGGGGGGIDMTSSNFAQTIIGEATQDCVNKLADILNQQTTNMKKTVREVEGRVADVSGNTLVINAGANDGVNVGEIFEILKVVREVKDPVTKEVLDAVTEKTGEMTITSVRDKIATGTYSGSPAAVGFMARKKISRLNGGHDR